MDDWASANSELAQHIRREVERTLDAYRSQPRLVEEHYRIEQEIRTGGYGHRQIYELAQNGADAIAESENAGRIHVINTDKALYCANEGAPIDADGVDAILASYLLRKKGTQIGQFGLGFKSVLALTDSPEFYSRSVSFRFDRDFATARIREAVGEVSYVPVLRLAVPTEPAEQAAADEILAELMPWATTVVKLPKNVRPAPSWPAVE